MQDLLIIKSILKVSKETLKYICQLENLGRYPDCHFVVMEYAATVIKSSMSIFQIVGMN